MRKCEPRTGILQSSLRNGAVLQSDASEEFEMLWVKVCCQENCYFIASCYHPPKPSYSVTDFVGQLCSTIESIIDCETNPIFLITGDFNSLATDFLEEEFGLSQLVQQSTSSSSSCGLS